MSKKTSINFIYLDLRAPTASLLQNLTVMQQCVCQMKFRNVCEDKKRLVQSGLVWSRTLSIPLSTKWRKRLLACVRIVGQHFKQFYCRQMKNGQLDKMSAKLLEM